VADTDTQLEELRGQLAEALSRASSSDEATFGLRSTLAEVMAQNEGLLAADADLRSRAEVAETALAEFQG
jgi:hypothetical protein